MLAAPAKVRLDPAREIMMANGRAFGSDLAKVDAHVITQEEYDELPEIDEVFIERAQHQPRPPRSKTRISLRLDDDLVERLQASGKDRRSRANDALRSWADANGI